MVKKKGSVSGGGAKRTRSVPLEVQLREDARAAAATLPVEDLADAEMGAATKKKKRQKKASHEAADEEEEFEDDSGAAARKMGETARRRVAELARAQRVEETRLEQRAALGGSETRAVSFENADDDDDEDEDDEDVEGSDVSEGDALEATLGGTGEPLSASEARLVDSFLSPETSGARRTFADVILAKIAEKQANEATGEGAQADDGALPAKVVEAFQAMAPILERYRSGKLPKAFKVLPALERWDEVLWLTRPDRWSPQCVFAATRVFASNLDPSRAITFYEEVLLERCRDDVRLNKKLNYHLYQALHRALFKPKAWFRGILLPLVQGHDPATLREALIFASVLAKASVPPAHAAVVVLKLAQLRAYNGAVSVFLIVLLNKKYALPQKVVDELLDHFLSFVQDSRTLPVLWHQSLLVFVQRYKHNLFGGSSTSTSSSSSEKKRDDLKLLLKTHTHHAITPDIRRELRASASTPVSGPSGDAASDAGASRKSAMMQLG